MADYDVADRHRETIRVLAEALKEAQLQIEHFHEIFKPTASGQGTLARIRAALALAEAEGKSDGSDA